MLAARPEAERGRKRWDLEIGKKKVLQAARAAKG